MGRQKWAFPKLILVIRLKPLAISLLFWLRFLYPANPLVQPDYIRLLLLRCRTKPCGSAPLPGLTLITPDERNQILIRRQIKGKNLNP
jgi:hypothetical protein